MTESSAMPGIGFIGIGAMGSRMARRLLAAGYPLTVYNRTPAKVQPLLAQGAQAAASPQALAASSDIILLSLADDAAVESLVLGRDGIVAAAQPGTICVDMSTIAPATSRTIAEVARQNAVAVLDAPVSGSVAQIEAGTLMIFVGGDAAIYQRCQPILDELGTSCYMGSSGAGTTMKLVANALLGVGMQALAEAIVLGEKAGLNRDRLLDVLGQTAVVAPSHKGKLENARHGDYPIAFALRLMYKDFGLILRTARELAVPMPVTAAAQQICAAEYAHGHEEDYSAVISLMEALAGTLPQA
jgi:3-hydroxyisobutyrate dehydrogenase-like beta-hydroxyacid dehydrogenase